MSTDPTINLDTVAGRAFEDETGGIAAALLTVARAMNRAKSHDQLCRQAGVALDRSGSALLYKLCTEGDDIRLSELAERLGTDAPAVTRKVQQLEAQGFLLRGPDPSDARAVRLSLTPAGRDAIQRLLAARRQWLGELLSEWSEHDRAELLRLLQQFALTISPRAEDDHGN